MNAAESQLARPGTSGIRLPGALECPLPPADGAPGAPPALPRGARLALEMLDRIEGGTLALTLPDGTTRCLGHGPQLAHLRVHDLAVFDAALAQGDIGFGEGYMKGAWDCGDGDELAALLGLLAANRKVLHAAIHGRFLRLLGHRLAHLLNANTRAGSRRNIEAHYDLGNAFYTLWLDPTMSYSAALFADGDSSTDAVRLADAQRRKYRRVLDQLGARPGQTVLEIGCGWGGFAEVAVQEYGCRVVGLTLSPAQLGYARARAAAGGYEAGVDFRLCDYRDLRGRFDHIASIEMIEAVGATYWPVYFDQLARLLAPGGRCVVQAITIADALFARYRRGTDFIQRHIFPGGMLPAPAAIRRHSARAGLTITDDFGFGLHYARTLACWRRSFDAQDEALTRLGFAQRFVRMWRFYLAYCEAGFRSGDLDVRHYTFAHRS